MLICMFLFILVFSIYHHASVAVNGLTFGLNSLHSCVTHDLILVFIGIQMRNDDVGNTQIHVLCIGLHLSQFGTSNDEKTFSLKCNEYSFRVETLCFGRIDLSSQTVNCSRYENVILKFQMK